MQLKYKETGFISIDAISKLHFLLMHGMIFAHCDGKKSTSGSTHVAAGTTQGRICFITVLGSTQFAGTS